MFVHRAAHVHQQQYLDLVVTLGHELDVKEAGVGRGAVDGVVQVEFGLGAFTGESAQPAQRDLDVSCAEFERVVVVLVGTLVPDLDGALVAALVLADAYALRVDAVGTEWTGAARAYPLAAAFVALFLLLEALLERLHQLVPAHLLDLGFVLGAELELEVLAQPVQRHFFGEVDQHLDALEVGAESTVELVIQGLVLDQRGARQVVELVDRTIDHAGFHRFEQGQEFLDRNRQFCRAQGVEKIDQHDWTFRAVNSPSSKHNDFKPDWPPLG